MIGALLVMAGLVAVLWAGAAWILDATLLETVPTAERNEEPDRYPAAGIAGAIVLAGGVVLLLRSPAIRRV